MSDYADNCAASGVFAKQGISGVLLFGLSDRFQWAVGISAMCGLPDVSDTSNP